ncbi:MAG TPA: nuclear transport factor 2 family protein [Sphingomicrobium sp.]
MRLVLVGSVTAVLMGAPPAHANEQASPARHGHAASVPADGASAIVDAFHAALRRGDVKAAAALLADDALIFESGEVERSKAEYAAHHLPADAEFSRSVPSVVAARKARSSGNMAWVASEGRTTGTYKGKALDLLTTETMVLRKIGRSWKIVHVHWSSAKQ